MECYPFKWSPRVQKFVDNIERKESEEKRQKNEKIQQEFFTKFMQRKTLNKLLIRTEDEILTKKIAWEMLEFEEEIQKIILQESCKWQKSFKTYSLEDLQQEGNTKYFDILEEAGKFRYVEKQLAFFRRSLQNHFKNMLKKEKRQEENKKLGKDLELIQNNALNEQDKIYLTDLFSAAPERIKKIEQAIQMLLSIREKPTNEKICGQLKWDNRKVDALGDFKRFLIKGGKDGSEKISKQRIFR